MNEYLAAVRYKNVSKALYLVGNVPDHEAARAAFTDGEGVAAALVLVWPPRTTGVPAVVRQPTK